MIVLVVSAREFRANQGKFLTAAKSGQPVLLTSRYGTFKITPVTEEDSLTENICRGLEEVSRIQAGELKGYTIDEALNEL